MPDFEEVYRLYFADVYKYVLALSRDGAVAEEITQETFFRALSTIGTFRGDCQLRVWLCQIARNLYTDHCRRAGGPKKMWFGLGENSILPYSGETRLRIRISRGKIPRKVLKCNSPWAMSFSKARKDPLSLTCGQTAPPKGEPRRGICLLSLPLGEVARRSRGGEDLSQTLTE